MNSTEQVADWTDRADILELDYYMPYMFRDRGNGQVSKKQYRVARDMAGRDTIGIYPTYEQAQRAAQDANRVLVRNLVAFGRVEVATDLMVAALVQSLEVGEKIDLTHIRHHRMVQAARIMVNTYKVGEQTWLELDDAVVLASRKLGMEG